MPRCDHGKLRLAERIDKPVDDLIQTLRKQAFGYFRAHTLREKGYPRLYVFEAYQVAALELLAEQGDELGERAGIRLFISIVVSPLICLHFALFGTLLIRRFYLIFSRSPSIQVLKKSLVSGP